MNGRTVSARKAAAESLKAFSKHGKYTNLEVASSLSRYSFSEEDKRLYTALVYGVAERIPTLDHVISGLSSRPLCDVDIDALTSLRLGLYQLIYMDRIPDHAALSETVALVPQRSRGFVNAVLREFLRRGKEIPLPPEEDTGAYFSVKYSCPAELCRFLISSLGRERAEGVLSASVSKRDVTLRVNTLVCSADELIRDVFPNGKINPLADDMIDVPTVGGADMTDARWFVQDAASRLAVSALSPVPGETVIDTCAAPGGKSFSAAIDMKNEGSVISFDLHANKTDLIKKGAERLGITIIEASANDASYPLEKYRGMADRVLCDAPCSGLGVMSKKPDIKYKDVSDIARLPEIQYRILCGASEYVRQRGALVYSTCTVNPDENEGVVKRFLEEYGDFSLTPFSAGGLSSDGMLTLLPQEHNTDGFFIAKMTRSADDKRT